jgi:hypothetical protein
VAIVERLAEGPGLRYLVDEGDPPEEHHLRALLWLLEEHPREERPPAASALRVLLAIATTPMPRGRVGHAYALEGGALGAPGAARARGVLWRYAWARVGPRLPDAARPH